VGAAGRRPLRAREVPHGAGSPGPGVPSSLALQRVTFLGDIESLNPSPVH
jgi:hypothetical protein